MRGAKLGTQGIKPLHEPLIACDIGLDAMRKERPHFAEWPSGRERLAGLPEGD